MKLFFVEWSSERKNRTYYYEGLVLAEDKSRVLDTISGQMDTKYTLTSEPEEVDLTKERVLDSREV